MVGLQIALKVTWVKEALDLYPDGVAVVSVKSIRDTEVTFITMCCALMYTYLNNDSKAAYTSVARAPDPAPCYFS